MTMPAEKFLVLLYDKDEQQAFWDVVPAENADLAGQRAAQLRERYATVVDVLSMKDLKETSKNILAMPVRRAEMYYRRMEKEEHAEDLPGRPASTLGPAIPPPSCLQGGGPGRER